MKTKIETIAKLFRGQTVTIEYSREFKKLYPYTFEIFNGKTGVVTEFFPSGDNNLVAIKLPFMKIETIVDRQHVKT